MNVNASVILCLLPIVMKMSMYEEFSLGFWVGNGFFTVPAGAR